MNIYKKYFLSQYKLELDNRGCILNIPNHLKPVINYSFKEGKAENTDGSYKVELVNCKYIKEWQGEKDVIQFQKSGSCIKVPATGRIEFSAAFGVELKIFPEKNPQNASNRINLIEGQSIPFALMLEDVPGADYFNLYASVHLQNGWSSISYHLWKYEKYTHQLFRVPKDTWTKIGFVFTGSDLVVFKNDKLIARRIFKNNNLIPVGDKPYHVGTFVDGHNYQFKGYLSYLSVWDMVPAPYFIKIDEAKEAGSDEIINKYAELNGDQGFLGKPLNYDENVEINEVKGLMRRFEHGYIFWSPETGAREVHGDILTAYLNHNNAYGHWPYDDAIKSDIFLGFPVSDEVTGAVARTRLSKFQNGAVYWSSTTGAWLLPSKIYAKYLSLGGDKSFLGLPVETDCTNGITVRFEGGTIFDRYEGVFEVHGAILQRYLKNPEVGVPTSDESPILDENGNDTGGRVSTFTNGTIFWSAGTGAVSVPHAFLDEYIKQGGPLGKLGYPVKDYRKSNFYSSSFSYDLMMQDFQNGIILSKTNAGVTDLKVINELEIYIADVVCGSIDDGWWIPGVKRDVSPELFANTFLKLITFDDQGNKTYQTLDNGTRWPGSGHAGDHLILHKTYKLNALKSNVWIELKMDFYDRDSSSDNDYLGTMTWTFIPETAWGLFEPNLGLYSSPLTSYNPDNVSGLEVIRTVFSSRLPSVHDPNRAFRDQYWWFFDNFKKNSISYEFYANTFSDVSVDENVLLHPINYALYKLLYEGIAKNGNCFGMSIEVMYAFANRSLFTFPLDKYKPFSGKPVISSESELPTPIHETLTRKHMYQLSSESICWLMKKLASFEAIKPLNVYDRVKERLAREKTVTISMVDIANGRGHAVLAYGIDESNNEKKILIADPNVPFTAFPAYPTISFIKVSNDNTFDHFSGRYKGDYASNDLLYPLLPGTLLIEFPYSVVSNEPSTPGWYVALALAALTGGIILLAGDAEVTSIKAHGKDFYQIKEGKRRIVMDAIKDFVRLPLLDTLPNSIEFYAAQTRLPSAMQFKVNGKKTNGEYTKIIRTGNTALMITSNTGLNEADEFSIEELDTATPYLKIKTQSSQKMMNIVYVVTNDLLGLNDRRVTVNLPIVKNVESVVGLDAETGAILLLPGVLDTAFDMTLDLMVDDKLITYNITLKANKPDETIKIIPQLNKEQKNVIVERSYIENGIHELTKDIIKMG